LAPPGWQGVKNSQKFTNPVILASLCYSRDRNDAVFKDGIIYFLYMFIHIYHFFRIWFSIIYILQHNVKITIICFGKLLDKLMF